MQVVNWARGTATGRRSPSPSLSAAWAENLSTSMSHASSVTSLHTSSSTGTELEAIPEAVETAAVAAVLTPPESLSAATSPQRNQRSPARLVSRFRSSMTYNRSQSAELVIGSPPSL